jgi:polyribonucleotide nucleotidyltransferase
MDVSAEKVGRVIGKNGATIKQVEAERKVVLDVSSISGTIHFTGSETAVKLAMADIETICKAVDVDVKVPDEVVSYFTTKVCVIVGYPAYF